MGNSEVLVKEALLSAEELGGIDAELIRLNDLHIKPCTGCESCMMRMQKGGVPECLTIKGDDLPWLMSKVVECDGLILGAPVYFLGPPGVLKVINDRMLPYEVAFFHETKHHTDPRNRTNRVAGLIAVGGGKHSWVAMGLALMKCFTFPQQITVVDQLQVTLANRPGQVLLNDTALERARKLGRNVAESMGKPAGEAKYLGEPGLCPVCHSNLIYPGERFQVECAICSCGGTLKPDGDRLTMVLDERSLSENRLTIPGRGVHFHEIGEVHAEFFRNVHLVKPKLSKYRTYKPYSKPGPKGGSLQSGRAALRA